MRSIAGAQAVEARCSQGFTISTIGRAQDVWERLRNGTSADAGPSLAF